MTLIKGKATRYSLASLRCVFILVVATYDYNNHLFAIFGQVGQSCDDIQAGQIGHGVQCFFRCSG